MIVLYPEQVEHRYDYRIGVAAVTVADGGSISRWTIAPWDMSLFEHRQAAEVLAGLNGM
jgi:hypothetical protein